jgi:hypothetical protein
MVRDIEEIAYKLMENIRPEWRRVVASIVSINNGELRIRIDEVPEYLNIVDALVMVRDLIKLILEIDEDEKVIAVNEWWYTKTEEEKKEGREGE